jgi:hypothetical protein
MIMLNQRLLPYYITRALISVLFAVWTATILQTWLGGLIAGVLLFAGFLWYAHGGWYQLDLTTPFFPLRRDERGQAIRNQALVVAVAMGGIVFAVVSVLASALSLTVSAGTIALIGAIGCYAAVTCWRFVRG